jgi:LuxR family maltose regulon positive regulatory protein
LARAHTLVSDERGGADLREWLQRVATVVAIDSGQAESAWNAAAGVADGFWGPVSRARVHIAYGDFTAARTEMSGAVPRCVRHRVVAGLLNARCSQGPDEALAHAGDALELAGTNLMLQTVVSEGREIMELIERAAWRVPSDWLDRVREAATHRQMPGTVRSTNGFVEVLTQRERDVLRLLPSRLTVKEMASELYISVNTLKFHLKVIYRKLGVSSRREAAEIARSMTSLPARASKPN